MFAHHGKSITCISYLCLHRLWHAHLARDFTDGTPRATFQTTSAIRSNGERTDRHFARIFLLSKTKTRPAYAGGTDKTCFPAPIWPPTQCISPTGGELLPP